MLTGIIQGLVITFLQFVFVTLFAYPSQFEPGSKYTLQAPKVPMRRWAFIAFMFYGINMLNNWAFAYNISVPVHIILRSFGSVTTMIAGFLRGKRYSPLQVLSVVLLTVGVLVSAWADSESKVRGLFKLTVYVLALTCDQGKKMSYESSASSSEYTQGLAILLLAQFLSAYMGAYTEATYEKYGASWTENLFYSHFLSLPLFLPLAGTLRHQYHKLSTTESIDFQQWGITMEHDKNSTANSIFATLLNYATGTPSGLFFLLTNAVTQLVCISGVNVLSAKSSAVTVTIVLNIRKLVSFILSTLIFGHSLDAKMILGSTLVFGSGALYGWETSWRLPRQRAAQTDGKPKVK